MTDVRAGDLLNDRYEIIAPIGSGAFANTWRARDNRLGRIVAVKILRPDLAIDPAFAARFLREAQTAAIVTSDNTVQMFDVGIDGNRHWIAMEFVDGESLRDRLRREGGPLQVADARSIMLQILRGLDAIHLGGIIHRDLKPENVLIGSDGVVRIADFGIALMQDQVGLTSTGTTFGSAAYMAPEQGLGQRVTPATDLYAAGVVLFEMLTGRLPFATSTTVAMLLAHQNQAVPSLASINPALAQEIVLDGVVHQALRKEPARRFQSGRSMAAAMNQMATVTTAAMPRKIAEPTIPIAIPQSKPIVVPQAQLTQSGSGALRLVFGLVLIATIIGFSVWFAFANGLIGDSGNEPEPTETSQPVVDVPTHPSNAAPTIEPISTTADTPVPTQEPTETDSTATDVPPEPSATEIPTEKPNEPINNSVPTIEPGTPPGGAENATGTPPIISN